VRLRVSFELSDNFFVIFGNLIKKRKAGTFIPRNITKAALRTSGNMIVDEVDYSRFMQLFERTLAINFVRDC